MEIESIIPHQWNQLFIRSLHKKGVKEDLNNQRGTFLTNIVSKVYEKIKLLQNEANLNKMPRMQCAGRKNSFPIDHIVTLYAIIENQTVKQEHTYLQFAHDFVGSGHVVFHSVHL